jgi:alkylation response protein AidB-like acyl-CoA dehydrogenase
LFIVFANVDPSKGYKGITAFLVERDFQGFSVGKKEDKLGIRASSTCELILDDCQVPDENVLGEVGRGYKIAMETLNEGRVGIGAQMLGLAQGAFDFAMRYMHERKQFGKAIADFQGVQFQYARIAADIEAARLLVYNAARLKDAGQSFMREAAMAKLFASEVAERAASTCVEFLGGSGSPRNTPRNDSTGTPRSARFTRVRATCSWLRSPSSCKRSTARRASAVNQAFALEFRHEEARPR